jgi:hypothetical protein
MSNYNINKRIAGLSLILLSSSVFFACKYDIEDLGPKATASFTVTPVAGQVNRYALVSNSQNTFIHEWDKATGQFIRGNATDTVYFSDKGTYTVRLLAYGPGGIDSAKQVITVAADDPAAQTPLKMLTNNGSKKWKLAPEASAMLIGPPDFSQTWWGNSTGDVTARSCQFNDEVTFNVNGAMIIDNKGDIWVDEEGGAAWPAGMPAIGCHPNSDIPAQFKAWTGGTFSFSLIGNTQLKVNGTGAYLGLYKAANPPDAAVTTPQSSITYQIVSISANRLVIKLDYGWGAWRFTYVPA